MDRTRSIRFSVGVVGHRSPRLVGADLSVLTASVRQVLGLVKERALTHPHGPGFRHPPAFDLVALSSLAEGADQTFAEQALDFGYSLLCPMPFPQPEYERDFTTADAIGYFRGLLARAAADDRLTVIELHGDRRHASESYAAAGSYVIRHAHLLVAVWDGEATDALGGTYDLLPVAHRRGLPVIWVRAVPPHHWAVLREIELAGHDDAAASDGLDSNLHEAIAVIDAALAAAAGG